ncbi:MAG: helix-turn-helix transcriptional regulator [Chloroflexi bacterium]|nr:helix-turn-helix transcriptional regulator [Chloroflexota bacterium]
MSTATVLVKNADRMMNAIKPVPEGIELSFADGCTGVIPFADIPEISGLADIDRVELPTPYEAVIWNASGEAAEIPWDFARAYCDPSYQSRVEAVSARGRMALGARIKQLRKDASVTQQDLARTAGIGRITLLRLERGEQSPTFKTLLLLAAALDRPVQDLVAPTASLSPHPP